MQASNRELHNEVNVAVKASKVGCEKDFRGHLGKSVVSLGELGLKRGGDIKDKNGLIDLDPFGTCGLEIGEESLIDGNKLGEEGDGLEPGLRLLSSFSEDKERDGAKNNGASGNTCCLSLLELLNSLVEVELEVSLIRELGYDKVVVGVEPNQRV